MGANRTWRLSKAAGFLPLLAFIACGGSLRRAAVSEIAPRLTVPMVGGVREYLVARGDSLASIGARFGVASRFLAESNGLSSSVRLKPGQALRIDNRHMLPKSLGNGILINIPQRLLFHFQGGRLIDWYPVAIGGPRWQTPTGEYEIVTREKDPVWDVPVSIQREMRAKGERVRKRVPPGPDNPLGEYWLGLSLECCGIHGTNAPQSVYTFQTHGCIRLSPEDAEELFSRVSIGTPVEIVYEPVLLAVDGDGALLVEAHPDVYGRTDGLRGHAAAIAHARAITVPRGSSLWDEALRRRDGVVVRLSSRPLESPGR